MFATTRPDDENSHRSSLVSVLAGARAVTLAPVDEAAVTQWLARYVDAWRTYDTDEVGALFSDDATYRYHPWDEGAEIVQGRPAIIASWLEEPDAAGSWSAEYQAWAVDGERAVAVGATRYLGSGRYDCRARVPQCVPASVRLRRPVLGVHRAVHAAHRLTRPYRSASTCSRAAPVPTSVTGTPSACSTNAT